MAEDTEKPVIPAAVYDIFYRADNNMWAQKVIDFVTLTWISRRTYKKKTDTVTLLHTPIQNKRYIL